ncbi:MAG: enoyl-CoA hydratase [Hyphomicrobiaceae bacterium]
MTDTLQAERPATGAYTEDILLRETRDHITTLILNRPKARNSLSEAMMAELTDAVVSCGTDTATRVIVLAANGPVFCAGHDLKELTARRTDADRGRAYFTEIMTQCSILMQTIVACPKPVIAAVHATATAAGCQLVATCDLAVAAESAGFCTPGVNIGLFCSTPMVALSRNVARKHAMEMLLTGEMIDSTTAADFGLVNRVVPDGDVLVQAHEMAALIAEKSPATVATGKVAFYQQLEKPLGAAYDFAADVMVRNMLHRDAEEGIGAFIEKRTPQWSDDT